MEVHAEAENTKSTLTLGKLQWNNRCEKQQNHKESCWVIGFCGFHVFCMWNVIKITSLYLIWTKLCWVTYPEETPTSGFAAGVNRSRSSDVVSWLVAPLCLGVQAGYQFVHTVGSAGVWCGDMGVNPQWSHRSSLISCGSSEPLLVCPLWMWAAVCVRVARKLRFSHSFFPFT